jgi:esterase FrsA
MARFWGTSSRGARSPKEKTKTKAQKKAPFRRISMTSLKQPPFKTPVPLFYAGPDLADLDLPCIIYLALSAEETLLTDPFNQPVLFLQNKYPVRVFSVDLPFHGNGLLATEAMSRWAEEMMSSNDVLGIFLDDLETSLHILFDHLNKPSKVAIMGLSRGGFLATHIAARFPEISTLLTYAPLTRLDECVEFKSLKDLPSVQNLDINKLTPKLLHKTIKTYIGNRDIRVGTDRCYTWIKNLTNAAFDHHIRSPHIELVLKPSMGHLGHGTSKETFEEGALWLAHKLGLS